MIQLFIGAQELILLVPVILLYVFCLFDCITNKKLQGNSRLLWIIIILIAPFLGSLIYLAIGRKGKEVGSV